MEGMPYWFWTMAAISWVVWFTEAEPPAPKVTLMKSGRISLSPSRVL